MVRASKTSDENPSSSSNINTEAKERNRLKSLAFSKKILSQAPAKSDAHLSPSKTVLKHHGKDIIKKSQRKNRFLFSFPGLIAPVSGGKIGELKDLGTKNPILYLDFPQGQMKLFGTIVYPENRYLTLQFSKGGKNVMCEDYFDNMIVFSDAWWIGRKDENPNEARLEFPKDLIDVKGEHTENDFKAGAGSSIVNKSPAKEMLTTIAKEQLPKIPTEDHSSDDDNSLKEQMEVTPVRHSERNMGKKFSYVEASSGDDSNGGDIAAAHAVEEKDAGSFSAHSDNEVRDAMEKVERSEEFSVSVSRSKKGSPSSTTKSKETSHSSHGSLVQATISTLFKKVEEKTVPKKRERPQSASVPGRKSLRTNSKKKVNQEGPTKKRKLMTQKDAGLATIAKHKDSEVEKDPIEELSSSSKGTDGSDDEWSG